MAIRHVQAHAEKGAWRGIVFNDRGDLLTRTVNTYPTSAAAITAAERLWDARCGQRDLLLVEGGAA